LALGEFPKGMRIDALRLFEEYAKLTGASKPGTSLLYEFNVGFVIAKSEGAC